MEVNSKNVYLEAVTTHRLPQGISMVSLAQLALAFVQMANDLGTQGAAAGQQEAFQSAIVDAAESAAHLTAAERTAVKNTVLTAFDGFPRKHTVMAVRADFLRQVVFPPATGSFGSLHVSAAMNADCTSVRAANFARLTRGPADLAHSADGSAPS